MRVVVVGIANQQTALPVDAFPVEYSPTRYLTGQIRHTVGGVGFNVARTLATFGHAVALAAPLGEDYPAAMIDAEAYRYGVTTHLCLRELRRTSRSVVLWNSDGRRQAYVDLTDASNFLFQPEQLAPDLFRAKLVVLGNLNMTRPLIEPLVANGSRIAVDLQDVQGPDNPWDQDFLRARYLNMSNVHVRGREVEVLKALREKSSAKVLVMTMDAEGALVLERNAPEPVHVPAPRVPVLNSVGAGDTFFATFMHHLLKSKLPAVEAARLACAAGARMVATDLVAATLDPEELRTILGMKRAEEHSPLAPEVRWSAEAPDEEL